MRLDPASIATIKREVADTLGDDARLRLFGSRLDDTRKGGDVDLMVEVDPPRRPRHRDRLHPRSPPDPRPRRPQGRRDPRRAEPAGAVDPPRCAGRWGAVVSTVCVRAQVAFP